MSGDYEYTNQWVEESNVDIRKAIGFRLVISLVTGALAVYAWEQRNPYLLAFAYTVFIKSFDSFLDWVMVLFK